LKTIILISAMLCITLLLSCSQNLTNLGVWENVGKVPFQDHKIKPQGLVYINSNDYLLSMHHDDKKTGVYLIDSKTNSIIKSFDMPLEASHSSGLTLNGNELIVLDYNSNKLYILDLKASLENSEAIVLNSFKTNIKGSSSCCYFEYENTAYLAVSDFMRTKSTYIIDYKKLINTQNYSNSIITKYRNRGLSQGLVYKDGLIFESHNTIFGNSVIDIIPFSRVLSGNTIKKCHIKTPLKGIEDLDFSGQYLWTTDEKKLNIYKFKLNFDRLKATLGDLYER
jgi:hypothetical protein